MPALVFVFVGFMALGGSYLSLQNIEPESGMIISVWSMICWGVFAFQASELRVLSGGSEFTYTLDSLFVLGLVSALIMLLTAMQQAFAAFRGQTGAREMEVGQ